MKRFACLALGMLAGCSPVARQDDVAPVEARANAAYNVAEDAAMRVHDLEESNRRLRADLDQLRLDHTEALNILVRKERQINELSRAYDAHLENHRAGILH